MKKEHLNWLQKNEACKGSIEWIEENNIQSLQDAWNACERGDWLLWMATKLNVDKRKLVLCGALCAHTVVQYMQDPRSREVVRIALLWGRGKATNAQLVDARTAADDAWTDAICAADAAVGAAADAADVVVCAADAAVCAAWTEAAVDAAKAAADATICAAWIGVANGAKAAIDAKKANELRTAEIARNILTDDIIEKIKEIE